MFYFHKWNHQSPKWSSLTLGLYFGFFRAFSFLTPLMKSCCLCSKYFSHLSTLCPHYFNPWSAFSLLIASHCLLLTLLQNHSLLAARWNFLNSRSNPVIPLFTIFLWLSMVPKINCKSLHMLNKALYPPLQTHLLPCSLFFMLQPFWTFFNISDRSHTLSYCITFTLSFPFTHNALPLSHPIFLFLANVYASLGSFLTVVLAQGLLFHGSTEFWTCLSWYASHLYFLFQCVSSQMECKFQA